MQEGLRQAGRGGIQPARAHTHLWIWPSKYTTIMGTASSNSSLKAAGVRTSRQSGSSLLQNLQEEAQAGFLSVLFSVIAIMCHNVWCGV